MKLLRIVALLMLLNASSALAATEIFDTILPEEVSTDTVSENLAVAISAHVR